MRAFIFVLTFLLGSRIDAAEPAPHYLDASFLEKQNLPTFCLSLVDGSFPGSGVLIRLVNQSRSQTGVLCQFTAPSKGVKTLVVRVICEGHSPEEACNDAGKPASLGKELACSWAQAESVEGVNRQGCRIKITSVESAGGPPRELRGLNLKTILNFAASQVTDSPKEEEDD